MRITKTSQIIVPKEELTNKEILWIRNKLTFNNPNYIGAQYNNKRAYNIPQFIHSYYENQYNFYISRGFLPLLQRKLKNKITNIDDYTIVHGNKFNLNGIKLRNYQKRAAKQALESHEGIIKMPCGSVKTITLLEIIRRSNQWSLVLAHSNLLFEQWIQYIKEFYNYDAGRIKGNDIELKPITVAMIQTLHNKELTDKFLNLWGLIAIDEVHHLPADSWNKIVNRFPAKYRFGVSATLKRTDGLSKMIFYGVGPKIYSISSNKLETLGHLVIPDVYIKDTDFYSYSNKYNNIVDELVLNTRRNNQIIQDLSSNQHRHNLVLSNRIEHLTQLANMYSKITDNYRIVIGSVNKNDRKEIIKQMRDGNLHTIFATQLADEGLDIPILDTLYLAFPTKAEGRIEQRIGRLQRPHTEKYPPIVYDYNDILNRKFNSFTDTRLNLYNNLNLIVHNAGRRFKIAS